MAIIECPLCCAEKFPDIYSLENHLLDLSENIICPICEQQYSSIETLARHLGQGCNIKPDKNTLSEVVGYYKSAEIDSKLQSRTNLISEDKYNKRALNEDPEIYFDNDTKKDNETNISEDQVESPLKCSDVLYSCSVCNITFTSIEDHLNKYHLDENVVVDNEPNVSLKENENAHKNQDQQDEISLSEVELLPKEASSVLWTTEDVNSLLIVNWSSNNCFIENQKIVLDNSSQISTLTPSTSKISKHQWILSGNYYYYCKDFDANKIDACKNKYMDLVECKEWPISLQQYPIATFISVSNEKSSKNFCENKPYIFRGHRVRLLKMKGKDGFPTLEDIPFIEEPPESLVPIIERAPMAPKDLDGTYSVMWPCYLCGALAYHWFDLTKHNCSSSSKYFPCTLCKETFQSRKNLNNHFSVAHKVYRPMLGRFSCSICQAQVQTTSHLEKHLAMHKKNDLKKCDKCNSLVRKAAYTGHIKAHEKQGALFLVCQSCNRAFKGETELNLHRPHCHLQENEKDNLKCAECRVSCKSLQMLREHMVSHDIPVKQYLCSFCPKSYHRLIDKVVHERVHTKTRPHFCSECGKCFRLRNGLIAHRRIHTGEKPFECTSCERTFRTKNLLRSHVATHGEYNQLKCKFCNRIFRTKIKLDHHEKFHKKPIICNFCRRTFYSQKIANKHKEKHRKNELCFACNMCPHMFDRAASLESHLRDEHNLDTITSISISTQKTYQDMEKSSF